MPETKVEIIYGLKFSGKHSCVHFYETKKMAEEAKKSIEEFSTKTMIIEPTIYYHK